MRPVYIVSSLFAVSLMVLGTAPVHTATAEEVEVWEQPQDPRDQLDRLDAELLELQRSLSTARRKDDQDLPRLQAEFDALQKKRAELVPLVEQYR
jgi:hypothetical protein